MVTLERNFLLFIERNRDENTKKIIRRKTKYIINAFFCLMNVFSDTPKIFQRRSCT